MNEWEVFFLVILSLLAGFSGGYTLIRARDDIRLRKAIRTQKLYQKEYYKAVQRFRTLMQLVIRDPHSAYTRYQEAATHPDFYSDVDRAVEAGEVPVVTGFTKGP